MNKNIGSIDRVARLLVGVILLSLVFVGPKSPYGYIGLIAVATAFIRICPLYSVLGISTCKKT